jgi:DNA topoisomerase III
LAAVMPDYEYRQTVVTMSVPVLENAAAEFRGASRCGSAGKPFIRQSIRTLRRDPVATLARETAIGAGKSDARKQHREQTLPSLSDGETAILSEPWSRRKKPTATPATMKHPGGRHAERWRFVEDAALRERLKEAKGIGTPCD